MFRTISMLSVLALSTAAFADEPPKTTPAAQPATTATPAATPATPATPAAAPAAAPAFDALDVNKDGALDKVEIAKVAQLVAELATVDGDKNGKLARVEFDAWVAKQPKPSSATGVAPAPADAPSQK